MPHSKKHEKDLKAKGMPKQMYEMMKSPMPPAKPSKSKKKKK